jgi:hypothetical protein
MRKYISKLKFPTNTNLFAKCKGFQLNRHTYDNLSGHKLGEFAPIQTFGDMQEVRGNLVTDYEATPKKEVSLVVKKIQNNLLILY